MFDNFRNESLFDSILEKEDLDEKKEFSKISLNENRIRLIISDIKSKGITLPEVFIRVEIDFPAWVNLTEFKNILFKLWNQIE
ncbi:MAG: hypothetical protein AAGF07_02780 [Patescibacteria group bacterium]